MTFDTLDRFSSGQYISVKLNGSLALPKTLAVENLSLKNFLVKSRLAEDHSLSIKATGEIQGAAGHFLYASSFLVKLNDSIVRSALYFSPESHGDKLVWNNESPINLDISAEKMSVPEVTNLLSSTNDKSFLRTTIYSFSDTGFKILKRIYHPIDVE